MNDLVPIERIETKILLIRGQKVMLDRDLAELYEVDNRHLKRQVRRNLDRFPEDFMFVLTEEEAQNVVCQIGAPSKSYFGGSLPYAFAEHGILMLSSVLKSRKAIQVNILIMRVFARLKNMITTHKELERKLDELEDRVDRHDTRIMNIIAQIKALMEPKEEKPVEEKPSKKIGFLK